MEGLMQDFPLTVHHIVWRMERLFAWWIPDEIRFIDEVPKTSVGKFAKKRLRVNAAPLISATAPPET
jgi:fatty-acyl-CoA synthase